MKLYWNQKYNKINSLRFGFVIKFCSWSKNSKNPVMTLSRVKLKHTTNFGPVGWKLWEELRWVWTQVILHHNFKNVRARLSYFGALDHYDLYINRKVFFWSFIFNCWTTFLNLQYILKFRLNIEILISNLGFLWSHAPYWKIEISKNWSYDKILPTNIPSPFFIFVSNTFH